MAQAEPPKRRQMHGKTVSSGLIEELRESPKTAMSGKLPAPSKGERKTTRDLIRKIQSPVRMAGGGNVELQGSGTFTNVYYLYGDERRAIRKAIVENTEYVRKAMECEGSDAFNLAWGEGMYSILCEEWQLYQHEHDLE